MKLPALAWIAAALLVSGCGGGGSDDEVHVHATWPCGGGTCVFSMSASGDSGGGMVAASPDPQKPQQ